MKPYSKDLRIRVLAAVDRGVPREEVAVTFSVSVPTIKRWLKRRRETGDVEAEPIPGRPRRKESGGELTLRRAVTSREAGGVPSGRQPCRPLLRSPATGVGLDAHEHSVVGGNGGGRPRAPARRI